MPSDDEVRGLPGNFTTCTTWASWPTSELTFERIQRVMAEERLNAPTEKSVRLSRKTFETFCALYDVKKVEVAPTAFPFDTITGLEVIFDDEMPYGKFKLD